MPTTRVKDAGFLQQHLEKLVLAGGALVLLIAVALFVAGIFGSPFAIEVAGQKYDNAADAIAVLEAADDRIERGIQNPEPLPETTPPRFRENIDAMLAQPVNSPGGVARLARPGITPDALTPEIPESPRYAMVYPPVPKEIEYTHGYDVLDAEFGQQGENFFALWGEAREPADFSMFIAAGEFDIWEWVQRLKGESGPAPSANEIPIPTGISFQRYGIAGVALLREEWDPASQTWTNRQIVEPLPGQAQVTPEDKAPTNPSEALRYVELMRERQTEIAQPELPWLTDFVQAVPPGGEDLRGGLDGRDAMGNVIDEDNLGPAELKIKEFEEVIAQLRERQQRELEREQERNRPRDDRRPDPRPQPGDRGTPDRGADPSRDPSRDPGNRERMSPIERQIANYQERIERLRPQAEKEAQARELEAERRRIAEERERAAQALRNQRDGGAFQEEFGNRLGGTGADGVQLQEGATLRVWAADATMEPGKTYRYKLLVAVINPLYAVPRLQADQLEENQAKAALFPSEQAIEQMNWSEPISVEPKAQFFFTSGGENRAKVDIYRRYNGVLQKQGFDVSPGDPIGGVVTIKDKENLEPDKDIDLGVGAVLVDIETRRDLNGRSVPVMIYMDEQGGLHERSQAADSNDPTRRTLDRLVKDGPDQALRPDPEAQPLDGRVPGRLGPDGRF